MKELPLINNQSSATDDCCTDDCCSDTPATSDPLKAREATPPTVADANERTVKRIDGMDCASCATTLERTVASKPGVARATVNFAAARLEVHHRSTVTSDDLDAAVEQAGFTVRSHQRAHHARLWRQPRFHATLASSAFFAAGLSMTLLNAPDRATIAAFIAAILVGGWLIFRAAITGLRAWHLDMNVLMTAAAIGAAAIGEWAEAASVVVLFSLGNTLQVHAIARTRTAVEALAELEPDTVHVRHANGVAATPIADVAAGDHIVIRPGDRIPLDARIVSGASAVDQSPVTGESTPVDKGTGDTLLSGSLNGDGSLTATVEHTAADSTLQRMVRMVEEAQSSTAPAEQFVDRFSRIYTPIVALLAVLLAAIPPLLGGDPSQWIYRALAMLIIACPCALVISTPVTVVSGIGAASRRGILIKGGAALEHAGRLTAIAFDKTGTLTEGRPTLATTHTTGDLTIDRAHDIAAALERHSEHPLAQAFLDSLATTTADNYTAIPGRGGEGDIDGQHYIIGSPRLFAERDIDITTISEALDRITAGGETPIVLGTPESAIAIFGVTDTIRPDARPTIEALRASGIDHITMLTGDADGAARRVADQLGIDYRAEMLPDQKVDAVRTLVNDHGYAGMVGDGVNDAPALAAATTSFAMGAAGSAIALESADVALMNDDLRKLGEAVDLSRRANTIIRQNIAASLLIKGVFVMLAPFGLVTLWLAVLADMGTSLAVTGNGMRLFRRSS